MASIELRFNGFKFCGSAWRLGNEPVVRFYVGHKFDAPGGLIIDLFLNSQFWRYFEGFENPSPRQGKSNRGDCL